MPLTLLPCTPADTPSLVRLNAAAFSRPSPINVFPNTSAVNAFRAARAQHAFQNDPFTLFLKIVDTDLPADEQLIAMAKWAKPHSEEERKQSGYVDLLLTDALPAECDRALIEGSEREKTAIVERVMAGRRFWYLQVLATHPEREGRGCAGRLIRWGMEKAEEEGVECYVEAQDTSKPIFVKYGWEDRGDLVVGDLKRGTIFVYEPGKKA